MPAFVVMYDFNLFCRDGLVPEISIESTQDREPLRVVVDDVANGVEHVSAFRIHVSRTLSIRSINADDRPVVSDTATSADHVIFRVFLSEMVFDKEVLRVIREAFMNPHVGGIFHRDVIAKPFMR